MPQTTPELEIFLAAPPGLEPVLCEEARALGFSEPAPAPGGVVTRGGWPEVWRANLVLRGAGRVLVRVGAFYAVHLAQLDKRVRRLPWAALLRPDVAVRVDAVAQRSRIWHGGAAAERVSHAIRDQAGAPVAAAAEVRVLVRIVEDLCTISLDTSGEPLHRRGTKQAVGKAPLRETLAALFLRAAGYRGEESVLDPMCGSGTIVLEAAEIAAGMPPGRSRGFAFERLPGFDAELWRGLVEETSTRTRRPALSFLGYDRDSGAIEMSRANAARAGLGDLVEFHRQPIAALAPPAAEPGLVLVNPPYGERIGEARELYALYGMLGRVLRERFGGWRVGLVTSEPRLAHATGLDFHGPGPPVPHGKLRIQLYRTHPLP